jgi:HAMP domain-containing protein
MLAIMFISISIVSVHSIISAKDLYRQKMNDLFRSTFQGVIGIREAELGVIQARCARLVRSTRIIAALQQSDRELLSDVADDELREFFKGQGKTAVGRRQAHYYLFLNDSNEVIAPGTGLTKLDDAVIVAVKQLKSQPGTPIQRNVYIAYEDQAYEMIYTPIDDVVGEGFLGTLALIYDYATAKPLTMADGGEMKNGLLLGEQLYGGQILESNKVAAKLVAAIAVANANRIGETPSTSGANSLKQGQYADDRGVEQASQTELEISIEDTDWLTHTYVLNEQVPPAYFVVSASLVPLQKEIQQLSFKYLVAVLVGACCAILLAFLVGIGLANPIKQLSLLSSKVAGGDYTGRVTVTRRDELGVLGERFNTMCEGLALRDKYRDGSIAFWRA